MRTLTTVDDAAVRAALRRFRGSLHEIMVEALKEGQEAALPEVKRQWGGLKVQGVRIATTMVVRWGGRTGAYITTTLTRKRAAVVWLFEFGGIVRSTIRPKRKWSKRDGRYPAALKIGDHFVSHIDTPRVYRERAPIRTALKISEGLIDDAVRDTYFKRIEQEGLPVT